MPLAPRVRFLSPALLAATFAALVSAPGAASADAVERPYAVTEQREACADYQPLRKPLFGDTHVHTAFSFDASTQDTRNTPRDAYRFAKGERVGLQPYDAKGQALRSAQLERPLDFTVVTDHAEMLGEVRTCNDPSAPGYDSDLCWLYQNMRPVLTAPLAVRGMVLKQRWNFCPAATADAELCHGNTRSAWNDIRAAAEEAYDRSAECRFTSFVGYEWTATATSQNLHRNVVFRNDRVTDLPSNWIEDASAWQHWQDLRRECLDAGTGCDALTIPHNSNLGGDGLMFMTAKLTSLADANGEVTREEAVLRQRMEPVIEIMQHKGDSECLLAGDTVDEACGFEKLPYDSFAGAQISRAPVMTNTGLLSDIGKPKRSAMVREALKKGLALEKELGVNPLKYGIIASTDTHLGTPGLVDERNAKGHGGAGLAAGAGLAPGLPDNLENNPGGLAVVWAEENARDSIFAALTRRETYGTSGPRHVVRFFGGWDYPDDLCAAPDFAARGYAGGVPMGGDLPEPGAAGGAPVFAVSALADPGTPASPGTPLQRVQIVKGWVDAKGATHEKVYDVAGGDNGASVDTSTCATSGDGAANLCAVWRDPAFDAKQGAFYYARVLENPTCRWSQQRCVAGGVDCSRPETITRGFEPCCAADHRKTVQERAWTSPIWYAP
ncbi:MAG: DUF3604 domain-containing protein [Myxococcota bacterium]|nr:DUF3604 domain-containing protein [Myxococcales bacterium]